MLRSSFLYALSESSARILLECDGENLRVSVKIDDSLLELRKDQRCPWLWVDETSIDTRDKPLDITTIYNKATRTIFWLGIPCPVKTSTLMRSFKMSTNDLDHPSIRITSMDIDPYQSNNKMSIRELEDTQPSTMFIDDHDYHDWETTGDFIVSVLQYFIQDQAIGELVCSKQPVIRLQSVEIPWKQFSLLLELLCPKNI
ncbi:hypothetical protein F4818DRAFT_14117 [Hypoxylon cercidicola]|nr:hypothetical protein F4818DRAFT_14117 [Hypoxylon cercidicola]